MKALEQSEIWLVAGSQCIGARSAEQMERNAALYREPIAPDLWSELKAEGLLREDAPVPT